jgi:hypothetical protein
LEFRVEELERMVDKIDRTHQDDWDNLERESHERAERMRDEMVSEVSAELKEFRMHAVTPLQTQVASLTELPSRLDDIESTMYMHSQAQRDNQEVGAALAELGRVSGGLAAEQGDHAEAIGNMMDMLERTGTHEDLERVSEDIAAEMQRVQRTVTEELEQMRNALDNTDSAATQLQHELGEQLEKFELQTQSMLDDEAKVIAREVLRLDNKLEEKTTEIQAAIEATDARCLENITDVKSQCEYLSNLVGSYTTSSKFKDESFMKMSTTMQALDAKVDSTSQVLHQKVELTAEEMDRQLAATLASLDAKLATVARAGITRAEMSSQKLKQETTEERLALEEQLARVRDQTERQEAILMTRLADETTQMQQRMELYVTELKGSFEQRHSETAEKTNSDLQTAMRQVLSAADRISGVEQKIEHAMIETNKKMELATTHFDDFRNQTNDHVASEVQTLKSKVQIDIDVITSEVKLEKHTSQTTLQRVESKQAADATKLAERIDDSIQKSADACVAMGRKFSDKSAEQDLTVSNNHLTFSSTITALENRFADKNAGIVQRIEDLTNSTNNSHSSVTNTMANWEAKNADITRQQTTQIESTRTQLTAAYTKLDARQSEQKQALNDEMSERLSKMAEQIQEVRVHANERCGQLDQVFSTRNTDFEDKVRAKHALIDTKLEEVAATGQTSANQLIRMDAAVTQVNDTIRDVRESVSKATVATEKKIELQLKARDNVLDELRSTVAKNYSHFAGVTSSTDAKLRTTDSKAVSMERARQQDSARATEHIDAVENHFQDDHRQFSDSITQVQSKLIELQTQLENKFIGQQQQISDLHLNLDEKYTEKTLTLESRLKDQSQFFTDSMANVETQSKAKDREHDKRFTDLTSLLMEKSHEALDLCHKLDNNGTARDSDHIELVNDVANSVQECRREALRLCQQIEKKVLDTDRLREDQFAEHSDTVDATLKRVGAKLETIEVAQQQRFVELQESIDANQLAGLTAATSMEMKLTAKIDATDEQVRKHYDYFRSECETIDARALDKCTMLDNKFAGRTTLMHEKLVALAETVAANHTQTTSETDAVDSKFSKMNLDMEGRLISCDDRASNLLQQMQTAQADRDAAQDEAISGQHAYFSEKVAELVRNLQSLDSRHEEANETLAATVHTHNESHTKSADVLLDNAFRETERQDIVVDSLRQDFERHVVVTARAQARTTEGLADSEREFKSQISSTVGELVKLMCDLVDLKEDVESQAAETIALQEAQIEMAGDINENSTQMAGEITRSVLALEGKVKNDIEPLQFATTKLQDDLAWFKVDSEAGGATWYKEVKTAVTDLGEQLEELRDEMGDGGGAAGPASIEAALDVSVMEFTLQTLDAHVSAIEKELNSLKAGLAK